MKKIIAILLVFILCLVWYFLADELKVTQDNIAEHSVVVSDQASSSNDEAGLSVLEQQSGSAISGRQTNLSELDHQSSAVPIQVHSLEKGNNSFVNGEYQEAPEDKTWRHARGLFYERELVDYEGFKLDKLEELANKGDLKAIEVLMKFELSNRNSKRYHELTELGAVHGSLDSLRGIGAQKMAEYVYSKTEANLLEIFAYKELQVKRGDLYVKSKIHVDYKLYNFYPNSEQAAYIDRRSNELMAELEKKRAILGLPPFDNSTTEWDRERYGEK